MRYGLIVLSMLFWSVTSAIAQVSISIGLPSVSIGINVPLYPNSSGCRATRLLRPATEVELLLLRWHVLVYQSDSWYASSWYNGPWGLWARRLCRCSFCGSLCATTGSAGTSAGGGRMRLRAGASTGAMTGAAPKWMGQVEPPFCSGARPRCQSISGSIRGIVIPNRPSGSRNFTARNTITNHVTP